MSSNQERRAHPRVEYMAQVQVSRDAEVHIMSTRNISRGGLFLIGSPSEYPEFTLRSVVDLVLFSANEDVDDFKCKARVVRTVTEHTAGRVPGFGLMFQDLNETQKKQVEQILQVAQNKK